MESFLRYALVILLLLGSWSSVRWYVARMGDGSDEPWGVFALMAAIVFAVLGRSERMSSWRYLLAAGCLLAVLLLGATITPLIVSFFVVLAIACLLVDRRCWIGHTGLFVLALPLISSLQFYGGYPLRWLIGKLSSGILNLFGFAVEVQGTVMKWRGEMIVIDAPCSGVQMLWGAAFLACVMICIQKTNLKSSLMILQVASASAFMGNVLRNVLLFFLESGLVGSATWAHEAVGLAVFVGVLAVILWVGGKVGSRSPRSCDREVRREGSRVAVWQPAVFLICLGVFSLLRTEPANALPEGRLVGNNIADQLRADLYRDGWVAVGLGEKDWEYAKGFPGTIALYQMENRSLVVRVIQRATRRYHLSADCYRAIGYVTEPMPILKEVDGAMWGRVMAIRGIERVEIRERVVSLDGQSWTDPSSWFWSAALGKSQGPWVGYSESVVLDEF